MDGQGDDDRGVSRHAFGRGRERTVTLGVLGLEEVMHAMRRGGDGEHREECGEHQPEGPSHGREHNSS